MPKGFQHKVMETFWHYKSQNGETQTGKILTLIFRFWYNITVYIVAKIPAQTEHPRACLKIAFCEIPSQFASDFMLDLGGVVGYIDEIQHIIRCKVGRKIVGMNFQTRSSKKRS